MLNKKHIVICALIFAYIGTSCLNAANSETSNTMNTTIMEQQVGKGKYAALYDLAKLPPGEAIRRLYNVYDRGNDPAKRVAAQDAARKIPGIYEYFREKFAQADPEEKGVRERGQ